jgi:predicted phosphodiesterase
MKLGVISDIHGNLPALESVLDQFEARGIEEFVCVGDIIGVLGSPHEVASYIKQHARHAVIGNHDLRVAPQRDWMPAKDYEVVEYEHTMDELDEATYEWLVSLPGMVETDDGLVLTHSRPDPASPSGTAKGDAGVHPRSFTSVATDLGDVVLLMGHTHYQHAVDLSKFDGQEGLVLNPGSVGFPFTHEVVPHDDGTASYIGKASFAVVDTDTREYELASVEYDSTPVVEHLREHDLGREVRGPKKKRGYGSMGHRRP